jgi:hypothetical protein
MRLVMEYRMCCLRLTLIYFRLLGAEDVDGEVGGGGWMSSLAYGRGLLLLIFFFFYNILY